MNTTHTASSDWRIQEFIAEAIGLVGGIAELARIAGVSERTVYAWKNGERHPSRTNLGRVTEYLEGMADEAWLQQAAPVPPWAGLRERGAEPPSGGRRYSGVPASPSAGIGSQGGSLPGGSSMYGSGYADGMDGERAPLAGRGGPSDRFDQPDRSDRSGRSGPFGPFGRSSRSNLSGHSAGAEGRERTYEEQFAEDFVLVEKARARPSAGGGSLETSGEREGAYAFRLDWVMQKTTDTTRLKIMEVMGRSMENTLHNGDMCLVNERDRELVEDRIYVIRVHDEIYVKRFSRAPGRYLFRGDNRELAYQDIEVDVTDESLNWEIIGRVIWAGKEF